MSLLPLLLAENYDYSPVGVLENLLQPLCISRAFPAEQLRELQSQLSRIDRDTSISVDKNQFQACIDVQQFKPEEITVKVTGDREISVEGKHEEKQDEHGYISRHFVRRYVLPEDCDISQVKSNLSSDGVLTIQAPKVEEKQLQYQEIPIQRTGQPAKSIEKKEEAQK